jgi:uncharacterized protein (TIGR00369 family)
MQDRHEPSQSNAAFEQVAQTIRAHLAAQGFMRLVGAELVALSPGQCTLTVARRPELLQQYGMFHGGVSAFLVDNATTVAAMSSLPPGRAGLTAEYKLSLLSPAMEERLTCRARVIKTGGTLVVVAADVFSIDRDSHERHVATALATIAVVDLARLPEVLPHPPEPT